MKPFRERNPVIVGLVGLVAIVLLMVGAFRAKELPLIGGGDVYSAAFSEAAGLKAGDDVRVAGIRVGEVEAVELAGDHVRVTFRLEDDAALGTDTAAEIKVKTLLGQMFLALESKGSGQLEAGSEIPLSRTQSPWDVVRVFEGIGDTAERIDTDQLSTALTTLADLTRNTPEEFKAALDGLSALSLNIAAKSDRIDQLLKNLDRVTTVLDERDQDLVQLMADADVLFRALVARREAVHNLLVATSELSVQLTALIEDSREDLEPALTHLQSVVGVLNKNEDNLDQSLRLLAPFYRVFANTLGTGPWFDVYIQNMPPVPDLANGGGIG